MINKILVFVDRYIHKIIPHPPCEKPHLAWPSYTVSTGTNTATTATNVHWNING